MKEIKQLREDYRQLKKSKERKQEYLHALRLQIKAIKKGLKEEYKRCKIFSREVMAFSASMYQSEGKAPQAIPTEE